MQSVRNNGHCVTKDKLFPFKLKYKNYLALIGTFISRSFRVPISFDFIQGVSRLVDITAGGDFLGLCHQKSSYKHMSDFGRLRSYDRLKLTIEGNDY